MKFAFTFIFLFYSASKLFSQDIDHYRYQNYKLGLDSTFSLFQVDFNKFDFDVSAELQVEKLSKYLRILDYLSEENEKYFRFVDEKKSEGKRNLFAAYAMKSSLGVYKVLLLDFRSDSKYQLGDYIGCISDVGQMRALKIEGYKGMGMAIYRCALAKLKIGRKAECCTLLSEAGELGYTESYKAIREICK